MSATTIRLPLRPTVFVLPGDAPTYSSDVGMSTPACVKVPGESRLYGFNFGDYPEIRDRGQTLIGTPTISSSPAGPTLGTPSIAGNVVLVQISGGTDAVDYVLTVSCGTSDTVSIVSGVATLQVRAVP